MDESLNELLREVDRNKLPATEQMAYDRMLSGGVPPIAPDGHMFGRAKFDAPDDLGWLAGTAIDMGGGRPVQPSKAVGSDPNVNRIVAAKLRAIRDKTGEDHNNFGCALLLLGDDRNRKRARKEFEEAAGLLDGDKLRSATVAANRRLVEIATVRSASRRVR